MDRVYLPCPRFSRAFSAETPAMASLGWLGNRTPLSRQIADKSLRSMQTRRPCRGPATFGSLMRGHEIIQMAGFDDVLCPPRRRYCGCRRILCLERSGSGSAALGAQPILSKDDPGCLIRAHADQLSTGNRHPQPHVRTLNEVFEGAWPDVGFGARQRLLEEIAQGSISSAAWC